MKNFTKKNYCLLGKKDWWEESNVAAVSSADRAAEGKHYCCSTRFLKSFETVVCFRIMKTLENLTFDDTFTALIGKIRIDPSPGLVELFIAHPNFCHIRSDITATSGILSFIHIFNTLKAYKVYPKA